MTRKKTSTYRRYFHGSPAIEFEGDVLHEMKVSAKCDVCGRSTKYRSLYTAERHCSEECNREAHFQIFQKLQERG